MTTKNSCLYKANVGDLVVCYFHKDDFGSYSPHPVKTDFHFPFPLISRTINLQVPCIGVPNVIEASFGMTKTYASHLRRRPELIGYKESWYIYKSDILVSAIIKKGCPSWHESFLHFPLAGVDKNAYLGKDQ